MVFKINADKKVGETLILKRFSHFLSNAADRNRTGTGV